MLHTENPLSDPEALLVTSTANCFCITKGLTESKISKIDTMSQKTDDGTRSTPTNSSSAENVFEWEEVKKARNRINSQRIRERERAQITNLEAERARLWLSNDAIKFQNRHFRECIAKILEVNEMKRSRAMASGGIGIGSTGMSSSAPGPSAALAASLGAANTLGSAASMQMPMAMRHNADIMSSLGGGLDTASLLQNSRLTAAVAPNNLSGLSDSDLLARHQATTLEMQNMMRQQGAINRFGAGGGLGMGDLNLNLNNGMNINGMNINGMNINGINMNSATSASPYADMAENLRIRQLMLQQSNASGISEFEPRGLLSSIGGGASSLLGNNTIGGTRDGATGNINGGLSLGTSALGDAGHGIGDADILQMSKRQKFGF